jgi:retinol-binding protein 3
VKIEAEKAMLQAQQLALEKLTASIKNPMAKAQAERSLRLVNAQLHPVVIPAAVKAAYAGTYQDRTITMEGDDLFYQRGTQPKRKLIPLTQDLFAVEGLDYFRIQMVREGDGAAEKLKNFYDNGEHDESVRTAKTF